MIRFLLFILTAYAIWQVVKFVLRILLVNWIRKNAGKAFQFQGGFGSGFNENQERPEGEIRVDQTVQKEKKGRSGQIEGEYVDFEEIK
jgi:hypothetical protein